MAKRKISTKLRMRKGKKRWFPVMAPKGLGGAEIAQVTAYDPADLLNRNLLVPMKSITGSARDSNINVKLTIIKVQGDTAQTDSIGIFTGDSQISRIGKRKSTKIDLVFYTNDKSGTKIKIKFVLFARETLTKTLKNDLRLLAEEQITKSLKKFEYVDFFTSMSIKKLGLDLKNDLKQVYPISDAVIWKATKFSK